MRRMTREEVRELENITERRKLTRREAGITPTINVANFLM